MRSRADPVSVLPRAVVWAVWVVSALGVTLGALALVLGLCTTGRWTQCSPAWSRRPCGRFRSRSSGPSSPPIGPAIRSVGSSWSSGSRKAWSSSAMSRQLRVPDRARHGPGRRAGRVGCPVGLGARFWTGAHLRALAVPDGRLPSRRWRPVAWLAAISIVVITVLTAVVLWPWRGPALLAPDTVTQDTSAFDVIFFPASGSCWAAAWPA